MNPETAISQTHTITGQVYAFFAAYPEAKWVLLAWLFGWIIAFIARPFIRLSPLPDRIESHLVLLTCILASAGAAAWIMWAVEHVVIIATVMGGLSPFGYLGLAALLRRWFPNFARHLSLQKDFTSAVDDEAVSQCTKDPAP
jgi:hypothetical protein